MAHNFQKPLNHTALTLNRNNYYTGTTAMNADFTGQTKLLKPLAHKRLAPEVNRILYVRNLPFNCTAEDLYDIFGKYGALRQIRLGQTNKTKGTAYVVYECIYDAKTALEKLSGFNVANRYLIVLYYNVSKHAAKNYEKETMELVKMQRQNRVNGEQQQQRATQQQSTFHAKQRV